METKFDMPLFYSSYLGITRWERYPMGNYTMTLIRDRPGTYRELFIRAQAKF